MLDRTTNLAYSLDGYLWAISTLASEKLQVRCVMETHVITINPPLQIVDIGNGCEAYCASIYIPAKSELTTTMQSITRLQYFLDYNFNYTNVSNFIVWYKTSFVNLSKEKKIESLKAKMLKLLTMSMDIFDKTLEKIDENYPFTLSPKLILALLIVTGVCFIAFGILFIWYKIKTCLTSSTVGNLNKLIPSLTEKKPTLNSLLPILSELKFPTNNQNTNVHTTAAVCSKPQITSDELSLTALVPRLQIKPIQPKTSTPPMSTNTKTKPLSLELFNRAAVDLDQKGEIELERYKKYLFNHE